MTRILSVMETATPRLRGNFFWGSLLEFQNHPLAFFKKLSAMGGLVRFRAVRVQLVLVTDPALVEQVLVSHAARYNKQTRGYDAVRLVLGQGLLTSEGDLWRRQRKIAQPAFHRRSIEKFAQLMTRATSDMADAWEKDFAPGKNFDVHAEMMQVTLRIVCQALLSRDIGAQVGAVGQAMTEGLEYLERRMLAPWTPPLWAPLPMARRARHALATLDGVVNDVIAERRAGANGDGDLLDMLLSARDETGAGMSDVQLRDEVMTMFLAGHETTANALSWTLYLLSQHPEVAEKLNQELASVLEGRLPTLEDLPKLGAVERVAKEAMRLYPPAWAMGRRAAEDDQLGEHRVHKGDIVIMSPWATQRLPQWWPEPERFNPDRFLPEAESGRPKFAYFPFGGGSRKCIGEAFAMMELRLILATLLQRVQLRLGDTPVDPHPVITLRPRSGLMMHCQ